MGSLPIALPTMAIIDHPRLVAVLTVWGATVAGFSVLALSSVDIARVSMLVGLGALGALAALVYAAIAALVGGLCAFIGASLAVWLLRRIPRPAAGRTKKPPRPSAAMLTDHGVQPIDPAHDLGSDSLDAPFESLSLSVADDPAEEADADDRAPATPHDAEAAALDESDDVLELVADEALDDDAIEAPVDAEQPGLDLAAFTMIVAEETREFEARRAQAQHARANGGAARRPAHSGRFFATPATATSGIARLRETAPQDLSLVELVERFAAALQDSQDKAPREIAAGNSGRERALAEALKALETLTHGDTAGGAPGAGSGAGSLNETERDLREALTRLQRVRGAA